MRHLVRIAACAALIGAGSTAAMAQQAAAPAAQTTPMSLSSTSFEDGGIIPNKYTQAAAPAAPVSPALAWKDVPAGTQSFALIVNDPDTAPGRNSEDILHWMAFNIPGTVTSLPEGLPNTATLPDGTIQAKARNGTAGFMGMGARAVYHHYTFQLFALDTKLGLTADATRADVLNAMNGHILGKAVVVGRFHR